MAERKRQVRRPVRHGRAHVPMIMQMEALECGAACLAMVMAYYEKWVPLERVRFDCGVSRDGSKATNMLRAAQNYGFTAKGYRMETDALRKKGTFPCIVHWEFNHFVVVNGFLGNRVSLNDPARGSIWISLEEFDRGFTGIVLEIVPGESFVPSGKRKSVLAFARKRLKGAAVAVVFVMLTTAIAYLFGIINPVMTRVFYDRLLSGTNRSWLMPFIILMSVLCGLQLLVEWIRTFYSLRIDGKMSVVGSTSYMWKVLHLPVEFFSQRLTGDILQREATNASIAGVFIHTAAPLLLNTAMTVFYLVLMIRYSFVLTVVGLGSVFLNLIAARIISEKRVNITRVQMRDAGKLASATLAGVSLTETIKASGAENGFFMQWAGYQAAVNTQVVRYTKLNAVLGIVPSIISSLTNYAVLFLGIRFAIDGQFTVGMIMAMSSYISAFMSPAMTLIESGQLLMEMRTDMERVEDVMEYPNDPYAAEEELQDGTDYSKLSGEVELKNVTFGYSRLGQPVVKDFSLHMHPGSRVAIVGASGCGKSTLSKLISGLYQPWSGEILFDGKPISDIPRSVFTGSVAVVDQDIILFEDTVAENIRMWDKSIADFEVILAARDAQLHDDIMQRPGGYDGMLTENGKDLSGGQRQRMEIARVLAQDPSIIILDEATSALDAKTEYDVTRAISERGISCIVIAHRLSTIRDCDEIIVLDHGEVVERGTHEELYRKGGAYAELVTDA